jgi:PRC-barrel domain
VLGIEVRSAGKTIGRIVDLLARPDGAVEAAVIEYGGFLGVGSRKVALAWSHLRFEREGKRLFAITDLAPDELATSADY